MSDLVIGVDGGGTKTAAWLAPLADDGSDTVLGRGLAGPGNPRSVGFEAAQVNIDAAIAAAFADAGLLRTTAAAACLGLAGAGRADEQQRIAAWAQERSIAAKIKVTTDADLVLGTEKSCIALIAGTGSLCLGRNQAGETARCGGWGYLMGDEGSSHAIAVAGLRAAVRAADGRGPETDLLPSLMHRLSASTSQELIAKVHAPEMTRERLAELAAVVFDFQSTDPVANRIVADAADNLAELVAVVARRLRLPTQGYTLAMSGGLLLNALNYVGEVTGRLLPIAPLPERWVVVPHPVDGAVQLAREFVLSRS
jgi:N-acetylglucosamine kinase-like BadF-type ATPase